MADNAIIVIDGIRILSDLESEYERKHSEWKIQCSAVHARFKKKTSRTKKKGKEYEYTIWYEEQPGDGLKSIGKEEPDYSKYYPPEPKPSGFIEFQEYVQEYEGHLLLTERYYQNYKTIFKDCLVFRLAECLNNNHPLIGR
ncbi:MAG TPA: hypothetical protein VKL21_10725 [Candidatus Methanoperedens sp.]|nr:hypothetical protein [Candidatus Methanoperedens sp.]